MVYSITRPFGFYCSINGPDLKMQWTAVKMNKKQSFFSPHKRSPLVSHVTLLKRVFWCPIWPLGRVSPPPPKIIWWVAETPAFLLPCFNRSTSHAFGQSTHLQHAAGCDLPRHTVNEGIIVLPLCKEPWQWLLCFLSNLLRNHLIIYFSPLFFMFSLFYGEMRAFHPSQISFPQHHPLLFSFTGKKKQTSLALAH